MYQERFYRHALKGLNTCEVAYKESDLYIVSNNALDQDALKAALIKYYSVIDAYAKEHAEFVTSLTPLIPDASAPCIVQDMTTASRSAGIGPFSTVAGAIAHYLGRDFMDKTDELLIENGGDIFININQPKRIGLYLGESFTKPTLTMTIASRGEPFGICSSSATIGHSLNFGTADLVTIIARDALIADAFATHYSNRIHTQADAHAVLDEAIKNPLIEGIVIAACKKLFFWGALQINQ